MDTVLEKLLAGVRRLNDEWREADAAKPAHEAATTRRQADFRRTMQLLSRFETSFRRASWKSGSEMMFPILFGHLSFTTHRCWTVFVRKAMWLAGEAWRQAYGQLATQDLEDEPCSITYTFPDGATVALPPGWREGVRDGKTVYESPTGQEYDSLDLLEDQLKRCRSGQGNASSGTAVTALRHFCANPKEGAVEDGDAVEEELGGGPPAAGVGAPQRASR